MAPISALGVNDYALRAFLILHLGYASTLINLGGSIAFRTTLVLLAALTLFGIVSAIFRGKLLGALFSIAILVMIVVQMSVFSNRAWTAINWNSAFAFFPLASFALFSVTVRNAERNARFFILICVLYCATYVVFSPEIIKAGVADPLRANDIIGPKVLLDDLRGPRLFLSGGHAAAAAFAAWMHLKGSNERNRTATIFCLGISVGAIIASNSRVLIVLFIAVFLLNLLVRSVGIKASVLLALLIGATAINIAGLFSIDWNVYQAFASDPSGQARATAYSLLGRAISNEFTFGVGLPPDVPSYFAYLRHSYVFWEDLGTVGVWAAFGLFGALVYLWMAVSSTQALRHSEPSTPELNGIFLAAGLFAIYSAFSPDIMTGGSMVLVWFALNRRKSR